MKKLMILGMSSAIALSASAQSLEERVEALEFKSYENFFKVSGQLMMRWDAANRNNKDRYDYGTSLTDYATTVITKKATYATLAASSAATAAAYLSDYNSTDCGGTTTIASTAKNGCVTRGKDQKDNGTMGSLFLKLNLESKPTDRLTFYGRLSMSKYMNVGTSTNGTQTGASENMPGSNDAFYDYRAGSQQRDSSVWVERAFANYKISDHGVFTFGRLPTIYGAPKHLKTGQSMMGNYPLAAFASIFDGMAYTHGLNGGHTLRVVYSTFQNIAFQDQIKGDSKADTKADAFTFMYELERSFSWARKMHLIFMQTHFDKMMLSGTDLTMAQDRTSLYTEFLGVAGSKFDIAFSYYQSIVNSKNNITGTGATSSIAFGGWLTGEADDTKTTGGGYGAVLRYEVTNKIKVGYEMFHNDKNAFAYDTANNEQVSIYNNYGTGQRIFYVQDLQGGLKVQADYTTVQTDYIRPYVNLIGEAEKVDVKTDVFAMRFITNF